MRYTKEMQIGKKQRRKKHKPSIIQRKDGRCYLCMLLNEDNGAKKHRNIIYSAGRTGIIQKKLD
ncbi:hypothetical protein [Blautia obeum]|uniref:hypothetical protein n=1 Tax=Blautia obeum TaxID=40520 RepID=UPI001D07CB46|nr:hypothetical protein [Blautia obeum]MCB7343369.1 hypothetical protein [Blautia obeum]